MPGLLRIPGFLIGKLSPRGRRIFWVAAAAALVCLGALAVALVPRITESKREQARTAREEAARSLAERTRRLRAEQRPVRGRVMAGTDLRAGVEEAIVRDVRRRARAGQVPNAAIRTECERLGRLRGRIGYSCTAVTSDIPATEVSPGGVIGYAYRALADPRSGRFALCKFSGHAAEGAFTRRPLVPLPGPCGGS